jgi:tetratricopeptide (TPR) repeat protein
MTLGTLYSDMFRYDEGKQWYQKAIAAGERLGDRSFAAVAHYNLSILETRFHRFDLALKETSVSLASQNRASGRLARGELLLRRLDFAGALTDYTAAYAIDISPLAKINLAQFCQITGRLEEARRYAEDCLKTGDLSWMLNYGIDPVRYQRDIRELLYKIWSGLAETEQLTPYGRPGEKIRARFWYISCRFKAAVNQQLYRKYSLAAGEAYGPETHSGNGPHFDSFIQYYRAFEGYPRRARVYLDKARAFESARIPAVTPAYDLEEGVLLKKPGLVQAALAGLDSLWERELIAAAYAELARREAGGARRDAAEQLYALNRGALRCQGIRLPVELEFRFSGTPEGTKHTAQLAKKISRALKKAGFDPVSGNGLASRFILTISLDNGEPGTPGLAGHIELYDREPGRSLLRRTLPLKSAAMADICDFVRSLSSQAFTEAGP